MADNDELTATKLLAILKEKYPSLNVSVSAVKRARVELGWTAKKTRYGALVSEVNQEKRVEWCRERQETGNMEFDDVLFTDECTVQETEQEELTCTIHTYIVATCTCNTYCITLCMYAAIVHVTVWFVATISLAISDHTAFVWPQNTPNT